jgi:hypothetical protein
MRTNRMYKLLWLTPLAMTIVAWKPLTDLRAQAAKSAAPAAQQVNITKEILDRKDTLNWKAAPNEIPADVCTILQVCGGATKVIALPVATEGSQRVGRGVLLTQDQKHADVLVLERQTPSDKYFFLLSPQGTLAKAAYAQVTSKSWLPIGMALAGPTFDKDKVVWHGWASKLGTAAAADKKPES